MPPFGGTKTLEWETNTPFCFVFFLHFWNCNQKLKNSILYVFFDHSPNPTATRLAEMAFRPPKMPILRVPGALWAPNGAHWVRIHRAVKFGRWVFRLKRPLRAGKYNFLCFWPILGTGRPENSQVFSMLTSPERGTKTLKQV